MMQLPYGKAPLYELAYGQAHYIEKIKAIAETGMYKWQIITIPNNDGISFANGYETKEGMIQVEPYSYLCRINYYVSQPEGANVLIRDIGVNQTYDTGRRSDIRQIAGTGYKSFPLEGVGDVGYLEAPWVLSPPGQIEFSVTNLSPNPGIIQVALDFLVPITNQSATNIVVGQVVPIN